MVLGYVMCRIVFYSFREIKEPNITCTVLVKRCAEVVKIQSGGSSGVKNGDGVSHQVENYFLHKNDVEC